MAFGECVQRVERGRVGLGGGEGQGGIGHDGAVGIRGTKVVDVDDGGIAGAMARNFRRYPGVSAGRFVDVPACAFALVDPAG